MDIVQIRDNIKNVIPNIEKWLFEIIADKESEKIITQLIRSQLQKSEDATGQKITPVYSDQYYNWKKKRKGGTSKNPNLKLTGELVDSMFTEIFDNYESIAIKFSKKVGSWNLGEIHEKHYGEEIAELNKKNLNYFKGYALNRLLIKIQDEING